ncbi:MAG: diguanylate cyclase domain-containing protein [Gammaproteobacteria bacterium]
MFNIKRVCIYGFACIIWAALTSVIIGLEYRLELQKVEESFNRRVLRVYESIERISRDNEAILEGFSAFLSAIDYVDRESASRYARQILSRYPHVYQLEVALLVQRNDLEAFISRQRQTWFPNFKVKAFDLSTGRLSKLKRNKQTYQPIIFIEPSLPDSKKRIGVDMGSEPLLRDALDQALKSLATVATRPFNLGEGPREYVLFRPIPDPPKGSQVKRKRALALLEINADSIRNEIQPLLNNLDFALYHAHYASDETKGLLFRTAAPAPTPLEARLFPKLTAERQLDGPGQPFKLEASKQLVWSDFDLPLLITTSTTTLLSLALLLLFLSNHYRREDQRKDAEKRLRHMATHDALTGLPNRTLLADRFRQACSRAKRRGTCFSIMFLDLNKFKMVNDRHGHEVGDQLLKVLGGLLRQCIRGEDTLSRISGDEFVILLEDTPYDKAEQVALKIKAKLAKPVFVRGIELNISLSQGVAVYPQDGTTVSELLKKADERMYQAKGMVKAGLQDPLRENSDDDLPIPGMPCRQLNRP